MKYKEPSARKLYYSIGEVAEMFQVNHSLIRFWEKEFEMTQLRRDSNGKRIFTQDEIDLLKVIHYLLKERGFTIQGAKARLRDNKDGTVRDTEVMEKLQKIKDFLLQLKEGL